MSHITCDVLVLGCGGFGSSAMYHLARRGYKVIGIDRFHPPHDQGSSHGETRIIRKAYFEHPDYVPLLHRSWDLWEELSAISDQRLIEQRDLVMSGPAGSEITEGARYSARLHNLPLQDLTHAEASRQYPMFRLPEDHTVTVESTAGFLDAEFCVNSHLKLAEYHGASLRCEETVESIAGSSTQLIVRTNRTTYSAAAGVMTCGAWTGQLLPEYAGHISVLRKTLGWFSSHGQHWAGDSRTPMFLLDVPEGQFYGLAGSDGASVKVGMHTGGTVVPDASAMNRQALMEDEQPLNQFVERRLCGVDTTAHRSVVCMYSMSPDGHFLFDRLNNLPLVVGAGFSGHGFKFTSVLGEAAADLTQHGRTSLPIEFLSRARLVQTNRR